MHPLRGPRPVFALAKQGWEDTWTQLSPTPSFLFSFDASPLILTLLSHLFSFLQRCLGDIKHIPWVGLGSGLRVRATELGVGQRGLGARRALPLRRAMRSGIRVPYYVPLGAGSGDEERSRRSLFAVLCGRTHLMGASAPVGEGMWDGCTPYEDRALCSCGRSRDGWSNGHS